MEDSCSQTPTLETDRLILRPLSVSDADEVFKNWASDADVARYMGWSTHHSPEQTRTWLKAEEEAADSHLNYSFGFVYKETGELIGSGGILYDADLDRYGLGYNFMKSYWGQGLATEATRRILDYAIREKGIRKFFAFHALENEASGNVIKKLDFKYHKNSMFFSRDGTKSHLRKEHFLDA